METININSVGQYKILEFDELDSTNMFALCNVDNAVDGTIIVAKHQTNGRGRLSRCWIGEKSGNVYMSIILKPENFNTYPALNVTQYMSVVVVRVLKQYYGVNAQIKWPNDVLVDGAKIAGILAETSIKNNRVNAIVLGLGLNVNLSEKVIKSIDKKATSLKMLLNREFDVSECIKHLSDEFFRNYDRFIEQGFSYIRDEYIAKSCFLNKKMKIENTSAPQGEYFISSVDGNGMLVALDDKNVEQTVISGDLIC